MTAKRHFKIVGNAGKCCATRIRREPIGCVYDDQQRGVRKYFATMKRSVS